MSPYYYLVINHHIWIHHVVRLATAKLNIKTDTCTRLITRGGVVWLVYTGCRTPSLYNSIRTLKQSTSTRICLAYTTAKCRYLSLCEGFFFSTASNPQRRKRAIVGRITNISLFA